jgi:RNA polymerase sigma-70 factor (ECF subfamily)
MTDSMLINQALAGDEPAFGALLERYRHRVYALAFHQLQDFDLAHDLAQEVFVQAFRKLAQLREPERFAGWLRSLTLNACRMWRRRREVDTVPLEFWDGEQPAGAGPQESVERSQLVAEVRCAVAALPERQRLTVTMFYLGGSSYAEIAEFLGESVNAIESRLHRARARLRERLTTMVGESFETHRLPAHFAEEVMQRLQPVRYEGPAGLLMHDESEREVLIPLTEREAGAVAMIASKVPPPRPFTQYLASRIWELCGIEMTRVVLHDVKRGQILAQVQLRHGDQEIVMEAQAGDAVILGLLRQADIYITKTADQKLRRKLRKAKAAQAVDDAAAVTAVPAEPEPAKNPEIEAFWEEHKERQRRYVTEMQQRLQQRRRRWNRVNWPQQPELHIAQLATDKNGNPVVVLSHAGGHWLPIWIGMAEACSIAAGLRDTSVSVDLQPGDTPLDSASMHDFIKTSLDTFGVQILWFAIDDLHEQTFMGVFGLQQGNQIHHIDARPSDGFALAVRYECPIYIAEKVWSRQRIDLALPARSEEGGFSRIYREHQEARAEKVTKHLALFTEAHETATNTIDQTGQAVRLELARLAHGQCLHRVLDHEGKVMWERSGGRVARYREYFHDFVYFVEMDKIKLEDGREYGVKVTVRKKPRWGVVLELSPLDASDAEAQSRGDAE